MIQLDTTNGAREILWSCLQVPLARLGDRLITHNLLGSRFPDATYSLPTYVAKTHSHSSPSTSVVTLNRSIPGCRRSHQRLDVTTVRRRSPYGADHTCPAGAVADRRRGHAAPHGGGRDAPRTVPPGCLTADTGRLTAVFGSCTRLGCHRTPDQAARELTCPCHNAAFAVTGQLIPHQLKTPPPALPRLASGRPTARSRSSHRK